MEKIGKINFKVIYPSKPVNLRSTFGGEVFMADKKEKIMWLSVTEKKIRMLWVLSWSYMDYNI